jgi:hypothetical protein
MPEPQPEDPAALRAEIDRLRALVGPSEQSYDDLRQDLLAATDVAKGAEAEAGMLRGQLAEMHVALARARQDQEYFQRMVPVGLRASWGRISRSLRSRFF